MDRNLKRQAATALGTLRELSLLGAAPADSIAYAARAVRDAVHPVALASRQVREMDAMARDGMEGLVLVRREIEEARRRARSAPPLAVCANVTGYSGHGGGARAQWTGAAARLLADARDRLDAAQGSLPVGRAATAPAIDSTHLLFGLL